MAISFGYKSRVVILLPDSRYVDAYDICGSVEYPTILQEDIEKKFVTIQHNPNNTDYACHSYVGWKSAASSAIIEMEPLSWWIALHLSTPYVLLCLLRHRKVTEIVVLSGERFKVRIKSHPYQLAA